MKAAIFKTVLGMWVLATRSRLGTFYCNSFEQAIRKFDELHALAQKKKGARK